MRVRIIANPVAGGGRGQRKAEELFLRLRDRVESVDLIITTCPGNAEEEAQVPGADLVIAVGGDGTANEVLNGIADTGAALGILPVGTANVVARELRLTHDVEQAAELVAKGARRPMDVGQCNGRRFLLGAGAGLDAAVAAAVKEKRGQKSSVWMWVVPSITTILTYRFPEVRAIVDGNVISDRAQYAIVGNCVYSAGVFPGTPKAKIDDGIFDVCLLHDLNPLRLARLAATVWNPNFIDLPYVTYTQGKEVTFEPVAAAVPLQIDGDPAGNLPATFTIAPSGVEVFTPTAMGL